MDESSTWDALARRYDTIVRFFDRSYPAVCERLAEDLGGRARLLEVAAGTGQFTARLADTVAEVVATDVSPAMAQRLGEMTRACGLTNVTVEVMSAYALDSEPGSFDAVFCANGLHVMGEPRRALAEFHRVLESDGLLITPTFLHGVDAARRLLSRSMSLVSPFVAHSRFDLDGLCGLVADAGFEVQRRERLPGVFPIGYVVAQRIAR